MTAPVVSSGAQLRLLGLTRRYGSRAVIVGITTASVAISLLVTAASLAFSPVDREVAVWSLVTAVVVPLFVAPLCSTAVVRLTSALATAVDELHVLATTDPLTGLANRRRFFAVAEGRLATAAPTTFVLAMLDLDHFKAVNDTHGHRAGDDALVTLALQLQAVVTGSGIAARLGGDEFVVLAEAPTDAMAALTSAVHASASSIVTPTGVQLSASVGLVIVDAGTSIDEALRLADLALYEAKGRRAHSSSR